MACPLVHPPAYRVPKPTRKPPANRKMKPRNVNNWFQLKISAGSNWEVSVIPLVARYCWVGSASTTGFGSLSNWAPTKAPTAIPPTKKRFQISFFQSYLKKAMSPGMHAAHKWRSELLMPNVLLPTSSRYGTVRPMSAPATYQGQGWWMSSSMDPIYFFNVLGQTKSVTVMSVFLMALNPPATSITLW